MMQRKSDEQNVHNGPLTIVLIPIYVSTTLNEPSLVVQLLYHPQPRQTVVAFPVEASPPAPKVLLRITTSNTVDS